MITRIIRWSPSHDTERKPLVSQHLYDKLPPEQKGKYRTLGPVHLRQSQADKPICGVGDWDLLGNIEDNQCPKCLTAYDLLQEKARKDYKSDRFRRNLTRWAHFGEGEWGALEWLALAAKTLGLGVILMLLAKPFLKGLHYVLYHDKEDKK